MYRSRKPNSWWVTPDLHFLGAIQYVLEGANWQRGGCKGDEPQPPSFPEDREAKLKSRDELADKRKKAREHLRKRRAQALQKPSH